MTTTDSTRFTLSWRALSLLALAGFAVLLPGLGGGTRLLTFHEVLYAQPARQMLASGDFLVPRFVDDPWQHKPPGYVWMTAASMAVLGESEWAVRLPAVISGIATVLITAMLAARWLGASVGMLAGFLSITSYYLILQSRLAEADMALAASVTGAMALFAVAAVDSPRGRSTGRWLPAAFYLLVTASALIKVIGPIFALGGCGLYALLSRDRAAWRFLLDPIALVVFAVTLAAWPVAALIAWPEVTDAWRIHLLERFTGGLGGAKPWPFYLYMIPAMALPWSPWAFFAALRAWRRGLLSRPLPRLLICWVVPGLVFLSISAFKHKHYCIPLLPAVTIAAAWGLHIDTTRRFANRFRWTWWLPLLMAAAALSGAGWLLTNDLPWRGPAAAALAVIAGGGGAMLLAQHRHMRTGWLAALIAPASVAAVIATVGVLPHFDSYRTRTELATRVNEVKGGEPVVIFELPEDQMVYYLHPPVVQIKTSAKLAELLHVHESILVLVQRGSMSSLPSGASVLELDADASTHKRTSGGREVVLVRLTRM